MKDIDPDTGEISFRGFGLRRVATILHSSVKFSEEMPEGHEIGIVYQAVRSVARGGKITSGRLLRTIRDSEQAFAQRPSESFVLVTSISARPFEDLTGREVGGTTVIFDRYLPEPFRSEHERAREIAEPQVLGRLPKLGTRLMWGYVPTRIPVHARSHLEASEAALDALNLLRGTWNLALNRNKGMRVSIGIRRPVNRLVLGPIHSLHDSGGRLVDDSPWIEDDYVGAIATYNLRPEWAYVQDYERFVWEELSRIPYRRDLEMAIRRYARALDRRDWHSSFVHLWGLLEMLTGTFRHEKVIARALALVKNEYKDFYRQALKHLNRYRNRTVHGGHETIVVETLLHDLKMHAENLLDFHLSAIPTFDYMEDAGLFLETATEMEVWRRSHIK